MKNLSLVIGVVPWIINLEEPRHNNIHHSIYKRLNTKSQRLIYFGPKQPEGNDWITPLLPLTVQRYYPAVSPLCAIKIKSNLGSLNQTRKSLFMYEGSISWMWNLVALGKILGTEKIVCNLFPASKIVTSTSKNYLKRVLFFLQIKIAQRISNGTLTCTVDTELASQELHTMFNVKIEVFPLISALDEITVKRNQPGTHHRALINIRNYSYKDLSEILTNSCKSCQFILPRGPMANLINEEFFEKHLNIHQDIQNIPEDQYQNYIDSFDYMIFLYEPNYDSSGKLLDSVARQVPVCIPIDSTEFVGIVENHLSYKTFRWSSIESAYLMFNHPKFTNPRNSVQPSRMAHFTNFVLPNSEASEAKPKLVLGLALFLLIYLQLQGLNLLRKILGSRA